jgi:predicted glycoside hydrolase/deacetylase ChbG (UPF0249 family)
MPFSRFIINADDFGYSEDVNQAILTSFECSLVNSTSLMANMPGFDHAIGLFHQHDFLQQKVGVHLNLTEGTPLTRRIRGCTVFCGDGGRFRYDRARSLFQLSRQEKEAINEEMEAQVERVLAAGIRPTHLDSHHHIHTEWAVAPLVCRLARVYDIPRVRLSRNMGPIASQSKRLYKKIMNRWYFGRRSGLVNTDFFGDIADMKFFSAAGRRIDQRWSFEIMVHPNFGEGGNLVDLDRKDLQQELLPVLRLHAA